MSDTELDEASILVGWIESEWSLDITFDLYFKGENLEAKANGNPLIRVYWLNLVPIPHALGYTHEEQNIFLGIDVKCSDRENTLATVKEIKRIIQSHRVNPLPTYNLVKINGTNKKADYAKFNWYILEVQFIRKRVPF